MNFDENPTGWFEPLYAAVARGDCEVPWSEGEGPNQLFAAWARGREGSGRALVVGCGLGGDSELTASLGYDTVAFDVSPTGIELVRSRHPGSSVRYVVADLLDPPAEWAGAFDLVVEVFTVQAMPRSVRARATTNVTGFVAPGGTLVVVATRAAGPAYEGPPWPMSRGDVEAFGAGLDTVSITEAGDGDKPRWVAEFRAPTRRA